MLKEYKHLSRDTVRFVALNSGLKLKLQQDGREDLNEYIFIYTDNVIDRYIQQTEQESKSGIVFYPANFTSEADGVGYVVTFRDIPECITSGTDFKEAVEYAQDAIEVCKDFYTDRPFPKPSDMQDGDVMIGVKL